NRDCTHRRREVAARSHPIPDFVKVALQILVELLERLTIHTGCAAIGPDHIRSLVYLARRSIATCLTQAPSASPLSGGGMSANSSRPSPLICPTMSRRATLPSDRPGSNSMTNSRGRPLNNLDALHARAKALSIHGLLAHWHDATAAGWPRDLIEWE